MVILRHINDYDIVTTYGSFGHTPQAALERSCSFGQHNDRRVLSQGPAVHLTAALNHIANRGQCDKQEY
jgi:hypothetical protein